MKKLIILLMMTFIFYFCSAQEVNIGERYQNHSGFYSRLSIQLPLAKKISLIGNYNVDGRGIISIEMTYEIYSGFHFLLGNGYHPYQDKNHPTIGIKVKKEIGRWNIDGRAVILFNHKTHLGLEVEVMKELSEKWRLGGIIEIESGKEFMSWKKAQKKYILKHPDKESVFFVGPTTQLIILKKLLFNSFISFGWQKKENTNFVFKTGASIGFYF